jgi:hypothetical protein
MHTKISTYQRSIDEGVWGLVAAIAVALKLTSVVGCPHDTGFIGGARRGARANQRRFEK